jgi:hypothetical protein
MPNQVRETAAGKSISAYIVLDKKGRHIASVHAHFSNGGTCTVDVWNHGGDAATERTAKALGYVLDDSGRITEGKHAGKSAYHVAGLQHGRAGGYGYDKFTAALSGLVIDGHKLTDHCGERLAPPKGRLWRDTDRARLARKGFSLSNWSPANSTNGYGRKGVPADEAGWVDAYRAEGLNYLTAMGYRVIKAI